MTTATLPRTARTEPSPTGAGPGQVHSSPPGPASSVRVWTALWVVYLVWGSTYLAIRVVVETMPALLSAGARFGFAGAVVVAYVAARRGLRAIRVSRAQIGACLLAGTLLMGANGIVTVAEEDVPSGLAALVIAAVPLVVILLRATVARERVSPASVVSVAVGFAGVGLLLLPGERPDGASVAGLLLCIAAAVAWALGSFASPRIDLPRDPVLSTGLQMLLGGAVVTAAGLLRGESGSVDPAAFSTESVVAFAYLVVFGSWLAFTCYVWLLQNAPVSKVATYAYVNPVVAIALGAVVLGESLTPGTVAASVVIVGSVAIVVRRESGVTRARPMR